MGSPNLNPRTSKGMPRPHICKKCGKKYAMEWAKLNHERRCNNEDRRS